MLKIIAGIALAVIVYYVAKTFLLIPTVSPMAFETIRATSFKDQLKVYEVWVMFALLAGFVVQEILRIGVRLFSPEHEPRGARWYDLGFLFAGVAASCYVFSTFA